MSESEPFLFLPHPGRGIPAGKRPAGAPFLFAPAKRSGKRKEKALPWVPSSRHSRCGRRLKTCHRHVFLTPRRLAIPPSQASERCRCATVRNSTAWCSRCLYISGPRRCARRWTTETPGFPKGPAGPFRSPEKGNFQGGKPFRERFSLLNAALPTFAVGAYRKHAGGMFLASDRSGYAARREVRRK